MTQQPEGNAQLALTRNTTLDRISRYQMPTLSCSTSMVSTLQSTATVSSTSGLPVPAILVAALAWMAV